MGSFRGLTLRKFFKFDIVIRRPTCVLPHFSAIPVKKTVFFSRVSCCLRDSSADLMNGNSTNYITFLQLFYLQLDIAKLKVPITVQCTVKTYSGLLNTNILYEFMTLKNHPSIIWATRAVLWATRSLPGFAHAWLRACPGHLPKTDKPPTALPFKVVPPKVVIFVVKLILLCK